MAITAIPIFPVADISANGFVSARLIEEAAQTFKLGTPVMLKAADGGVQAWDGTTGTAFTFTSSTIGGIVGMSYEAASNLGATGSGAAGVMQPFAGLGAAVTFGSVPNQSSAKNIPHGAPFNEGRVGFVLAQPNVLFAATFGNAGNTATPAATDVGKNYGLTVDTGGNFWYVDKSKATPGTNTVLTVVALDPRDTPAAGSRVLFTLDPRFIQQLNLSI